MSLTRPQWHEIVTGVELLATSWAGKLVLGWEEVGADMFNQEAVFAGVRICGVGVEEVSPSKLKVFKEKARDVLGFSAPCFRDWAFSDPRNNRRFHFYICPETMSNRIKKFCD